MQSFQMFLCKQIGEKTHVCLMSFFCNCALCCVNLSNEIPTRMLKFVDKIRTSSKGLNDFCKALNDASLLAAPIKGINKLIGYPHPFLCFPSNVFIPIAEFPFPTAAPTPTPPRTKHKLVTEGKKLTFRCGKKIASKRGNI